MKLYVWMRKCAISLSYACIVVTNDIVVKLYEVGIWEDVVELGFQGKF